MKKTMIATGKGWGILVLLVTGGSLVAWGQWGLGGIFSGGGIGGDVGGTPPSRFAFRPWLSANGSYSQVLGEPRQTGARRDFYGYGAAGGMSGARRWERTTVSGFYTASYQRFSGGQSVEGMSQVGGVAVSHQATEKVGLYVWQFAGSSLGGYGYGAPAGAFGGWGIAGAALTPEAGLLGAPVADFAGNGLVDNEVFGSRVNYYGTSGGINFRPSLRWSMSGGAQANFVRRKGAGLRDLNSSGVFGSTSYLVSQRTAIGGGYGWNQFSYPKLFGDNRAQYASIFLSHQATPLTRIGLAFGAYQMNTTFLGAVAVDPQIAELLGVPVQLDVQKRAFRGWQGSATVSRPWREWGTSLSYAHGVNPGNGFMLASRRDSIFGSAGRSLGRVSIGIYGGYYRWSGLLQNTKLTSGSVGASAGLRLVGDLFFGLNGGYSAFDTPGTTRRWQRFVSAHLTWSPSDAAFRF